MKTLSNNNGIALITSLMFTVMALVISMALLYMVTAGTRTSGAMKIYRTALDASYGGTDIIAKDLIAAGFSYKAMTDTAFVSQMKNTYMTSFSNPAVAACLRTKLSLPRSQWGACADTSASAKIGTDISFDLMATTGNPFTVYSKIVDTMERKFTVLQSYSGAKNSMTVTRAGNTDESGTTLDFGSTTEGAGVSVPHYPYIYRIEVQGERKQSASQKSMLSVLYAY
jgi:hypothetical protein